MTLTLGPILGAVSHDAARIWFQAEHLGDVLVHVFHEAGAEIAGSPFRPASLGKQANGRCRRLPPNHDGRWPATRADDWCLGFISSLAETGRN